MKNKKTKGIEETRKMKEMKEMKEMKGTKGIENNIEASIMPRLRSWFNIGFDAGLNVGRKLYSNLIYLAQTSKNLCYRSISDTEVFLNKKIILPESTIPSLASILPYRTFDKAQGLYYNEKSTGFLLEANPLIGASQATATILTGMITDGVPAGCTIQIINVASPRVGSILKEWTDARSQTGGVYTKLAKKRFEYYAKSNWESLFSHPHCLLRNFRLFIAVSIPLDHSDSFHSSFSSSSPSSSSSHSSSHSELKCEVQLKSLKSHLKSTLSTIGLSPIEVYPDRFLSALDELLNPNRSLFPSVKKCDSINPLNVQLRNGETTLEIEPDQIVFETINREGEEEEEERLGEVGEKTGKKVEKEKIERTAVRCLTVNRFPESWSQWQMTDLIGDRDSDYLTIPCPFLQMSSFTFLEEIKSSGKACRKSLRATQQAGTELARYISDLGERARDWQFVVNKLNQGQKLVKAYFEVVLYAKEDEIEEAEQMVRSLYRSKGWELVRDRYVQFQSWLMSLPFMPSEGLFEDLDKLRRTKTMITWTVANVSPLQGEWKGMNSPLVLLVGKRGQPFFWDPYANDRGNFNVSIAGTTGSGKSVFLQETISSLRGLGGQVIVIEDGYSSRNSCLLQGGTYVSFSGKNVISLNPFSIISEDAFSKLNSDSSYGSNFNLSSDLEKEKGKEINKGKEEERNEYRTDVICFISDLVRRMCRSVGDTSDVENSYIDYAVIHVLETKGRRGEVSDVANYLLAQDDSRARDLGTMLSPYTKGGRYGHFFEGQSEIRLDQNLMAFEFSELKEMEDLSEIVLILLMFLVSEKMYRGNRKQRIILVIDEAWSLLKGKLSGKFIEGVVRRARKYNGCLITSVQDVGSYFKTAAGEAAWTCSHWKCILSQNDDAIEGLKKDSDKMVMDDEKERALKSLKMEDGKYSEVLIEGPYGWAVGRLILDPFSIALYSSKAADFERIQSLQEQGLSIEEAVEFVSEEIKNKRKV